EREALLRPVDPHEVARHPLDGRVVAAGEVANPGALDLDDPGPQVCELAGGERGRDGLLAADDGDALERAGAGHAMPPIPCCTGAVVMDARPGDAGPRRGSTVRARGSALSHGSGLLHEPFGDREAQRAPTASRSCTRSPA